MVACGGEAAAGMVVYHRKMEKVDELERIALYLERERIKKMKKNNKKGFLNCTKRHRIKIVGFAYCSTTRIRDLCA